MLVNAVGVFLLAVVVDYLYVHWLKATSTGVAAHAVAASILIQFAGVAGLLLVVGTPLLLVANALGHGLGTYLGMRAGGDQDIDNEGDGGTSPEDDWFRCGGDSDGWILLSHDGPTTLSTDGGREST